MVNAFEWAVIALLVVGLLIPAWLVALSVKSYVRRPRGGEPSARYGAYVRLLNSIHSGIATGTVENGAVWAASIRELQNYPEYRDLSILYLEEITITGSNKFDAIMKAELKSIESSLLGTGNE